MVPRVAMFTMAGETFLIIGDRDGTRVSPITDGMAAETGNVTAAEASSTVQARGTRSDLTSDVAGGIDFMRPIITCGDTGCLCHRSGRNAPKYVAIPAQRSFVPTPPLPGGSRLGDPPGKLAESLVRRRSKSDAAARPGSSEWLLPEPHWSAWL